MVANSSPRYDLHLMNAIGASVTRSNGFVYAFNILIQMGALPQVTYFESPRRDTFDSLEAGVADFSRMLEHGNEDKIDRLRDYIAHHMIENPHAGERDPRAYRRDVHARPHPQSPMGVYRLGASLCAPPVAHLKLASSSRAASAFFANWANALHTAPFLRYRGTAHVD